jgi:uncharacterized protein YjbI with pentapeptide repeats
MRNLPRLFLLALCFGSMLVARPVAQEQTKQTCPLPYRWKPTPEDFRKILLHHKEWAKQAVRGYGGWVSAGHEQGRANLCNADLRGADLNGANLIGADLNGADLTGADLNGSILAGAKLNLALLVEAKLNDADLIGAGLSGAVLSGAELNKATLEYANLERAGGSWTKLNGANLISANLDRVILNEPQLDRANLRGARLNGAVLLFAKLNDANLTGATLNNTDLSGADLNDANLSRAQLNKAKLWAVKLNNANLNWAELNGADLFKAELKEATLGETKLNDANLSFTQLNGMKLIRASVDGAQLAFADLTDAKYAPKSASPHSFVAGIKGLETVTFPSGEQGGLVLLRELLQKAGLRDLEREATFAIENGKTTHALKAWSQKPLEAAEGVFRMVLFGWTTAYGLRPAQALLFIVALWALLIPVYWWPIWCRSVDGSSGVFRSWPKDRIEVQKGRPTLDNSPRIERLHDRGVASLGWSAYFSLLSAFHIGFREFSVGSWIARMQPRSFTLEATGWVRTLSGAQSLLSVYLLAMWVLTYFGRPFQ